jgi:hypothetical protein
MSMVDFMLLRLLGYRGLRIPVDVVELGILLPLRMLGVSEVPIDEIPLMRKV